MLIHRLLNPTNRIFFEGSDDSGGGGSDKMLQKILDSIDEKLGKNVLGGDVIDSLKSLAKRTNDGNMDPMHKILFKDNYQLRQQISDLKDKTVGEDNEIVTKDQKALLDSLEEQGIKSLDDVTKLKEEKDEAVTKLAETQNEIRFAEIESIYGAKKDVVKKLISDAKFETGKKKNEDGEEVDAVFVIHGEDGSDKTEFSKYVDENLEEFKPSLFNGNKDQNTGRKFVRQTPSGSGSKTGNMKQKFLENRNKRVSTGNALKKPKQESKNE